MDSHLGSCRGGPSARANTVLVRHFAQQMNTALATKLASVLFKGFMALVICLNTRARA